MMVTDRYYVETLAAERLRKCYEIAPPRVRQYLQAEIEYTLSGLKGTDEVLELGCGYGRVLAFVAAAVRGTFGIDNSMSSLLMARAETREHKNCHLACMDAIRLGFGDDTFDRVICIQNGISAFHVDQRCLVAEALRVVRPGGAVVFSTYSAEFWEDRLDWFERQAKVGLVGEIDYERSGDGRIVCRDGFTATTVSPEEFTNIARDLDVRMRLLEVDNSSLFCEMIPEI